jgi:methyl-accepting chemotaxis protein
VRVVRDDTAGAGGRRDGGRDNLRHLTPEPFGPSNLPLGPPEESLRWQPRSRLKLSLFTKTLAGYLLLALLLSLVVPPLVTATGVQGLAARAISAGIGILLALGFANAASRVLSGVRALSRSALEISQGDLSKPVSRERSLRLGEDEIDELAKSIADMQQNLRELVSHIQNSARSVAESAGDMLHWAEDVNGSTQEVARSATHISQGASDQKRSVEQSSEVIAAIALSIRATAESSRDAAHAAEATAETAEASGASVRQAAEKVRKVFAGIESASGQVFAFGAKTHEISKIVEAITAVAQQTNMLALNATIEAARAGDAGRGFAVVAEEVRKLAERAQGSAEQISRLAEDIAGRSTGVVSAMREGIEELAEGREELSAILRTLEDISGTARAGAQKVAGITASAEDQRKHSEEMVQAIGHISKVAHANAAATEEVSSAIGAQTHSVGQMTSSAQELTNVALELQSMVSRFRL